LDIKTKSGASELVSFKDAWNTEKAMIALATTAMYEAAGNLIWCNPFLANEDDEVLAGDPVLWSQVREVAESHFKVAVTSIKELASSPAKGTAHAETRGKALAETQGPDVTRIVFPITLPVHGTEINKAKNPSLKSCLHVLSGHVYIYGWYLAMHDALDAGSPQDVLALWQCCLTTTLHVRVGLTLTELAVLSIQQSEGRKTMDIRQIRA
jgi:hypothetical protein